MEDYNKVLDATEVAENANGVAAEKMTVYNESLAAAQNRLTASIQQFAQDSNLDQILALAYDGLSKVMDILNILLNKIPILSPLVKALGIALAAAFAQNMLTNLAKTNTGIGTLVSTITNALPNVINFASLLKGEFVTAFVSAASASTGLTAGLSGLQAGLAAAGGAITTFVNPITIAIAAIGALLVVIPQAVSWLNKLKEAKENALKESTQELEDANRNLEETNNQIKEIQNKIIEIDKQGPLTLADQAEKDRLNEQLDVLKEIQKVQEEIAKIKAEEQAQDIRNIVGSKYTKTGTSDEALSILQETEAGYGGDIYKRLEKNVYATESASVEQLAANIKFLDEQKKNLSATDDDYRQKLEKINQLEAESKNQLLAHKKELIEYESTLAKAGDTSSDEYNTIISRIDEISLMLDPSNFGKLKLSELIDDSNVKAKLKVFSATARNAVAKAAEDSSDEAQNAADTAIANLNTSITAGAKQITEKISKDENLKAKFAEIFNVDPKNLNLDDITAYIEKYLTQQYGNVAKVVQNTVQPVLKSTATLVEELGQEQVDLANKTKSLSDAYNAMAKNGKITSAQMNALLKLYPELASAIEVQNGAIRVNIDVLKEKYNVLVDTEIKQKESQIATTELVIEQTKRRIESYQAEMSAISEVLVGRNYILETYDDESGLGVSQRSQSVESTTDQLNYQVEKLKQAEANLKILQASLDDLKSQTLTYTDTKTGSSAADKAAKEFENSVKEKIKNLKGVVTTYSADGFGAWSSQEAIDKATTKYNKFLSEIVNNPAARKVAAEQLGISIDGESEAEQIRMVTNVLKEQASTIDEARQKLQENYLKGLKEVEEAEKKQYEEAKKQIEALNKMTQDMIETAIDLLDKAGSFVFDMLGKVSDRYDKQIDNLDKIMDDLDNQKDAFDDKIDAQKEYLKLQKEEIDNQKELAEKTQSIADIDARLIEMQYDDSAAAQAERLKLLDERAKKEKELKDFQDETAYDAQMNALDAQKKQFDAVIETQKKALEQQKQALEESQKKFESTVSSIKSAFDGFIKILNSTVFKNLATNLLNSIDGETLNKALSLWNSLFGTGLQSDVTSTWDAAYGAASKYGWQPGKNLQGVTNAISQGISTKESNVTQIEQAQAANKAGDLNLADSITSGLKTDSIQKQLDQVTSIFDSTKTTIGNIMNNLGLGIEQTFGNVGKNIISFANGIGGSIQKGVQTASDIFNGLGQTLRNVFKIDWNGITGGISEGLGAVSNIFGQMFNPIANGASAIGDAIGAGVTGFFPGIFTALSSLVTTVGTAMSGLLTSIATALASIPFVGWALAAVALAGVAALVASIANVSSQTKNAKVAQPTQSFHAKKHHSGADYVKKENPELDKMLGLNDDETVSILKVGEAVIPTWANTATSSASGNVYTGEVATKAVDTAKQATRTSYSISGGSSVVNTISMPITIQGSADDSTVKALKEQSEKIAKTVFKLINKQTNMSGYRNVKAATI